MSTPVSFIDNNKTVHELLNNVLEILILGLPFVTDPTDKQKVDEQKKLIEEERLNWLKLSQLEQSKKALITETNSNMDEYKKKTKGFDELNNEMGRAWNAMLIQRKKFLRGLFDVEKNLMNHKEFGLIDCIMEEKKEEQPIKQEYALEFGNTFGKEPYDPIIKKIYDEQSGQLK